jgi:transposase
MTPPPLPITPGQLASLPPELRAIVRTLIDHYEARIAALQAELATARKTPRNSSLPPSSEHPHAKPPARRAPSKKKRGGQPGHAKHERALVPLERCDEVVTLRPDACRRCGGPLQGDDLRPLRHQVWDVPPIRPHVTEYRRHRLNCPGCGLSTCGGLPPGVPTGTAGPRLVALSALLMGCFRQSKRRVALFLEQVLGQPCSPGWVVKLQARATAALEPAARELVAELPSQPVLGIDETPTRQAGGKAWLWTFVASRFTAFAIRPTRAATVLTEHLTGDFSGVVGCDRARMYWSLGRLQWCWAHLKRDFQALIDHDDGRVRRLGHDLMRKTKDLFGLWGDLRRGKLSRADWGRAMGPVRREVDDLLLRGRFSGHPRLVGMCRELHRHRARLWAFLEVEGVEPTNNASERALRHAVIWRKLSFGTQSERGSRFVETMLGVVETCRQQGRNVFGYITDAVQAHYAKQPTPSLLNGV